jgi:hypothetical protein
MSSKNRKPTDSDLPPILELRQQMSEIISLREKVAQAELAAQHRSSITDVEDRSSERLEIVAKPAR